MKKILNLFAQTFLFTSFSLTTIACHNRLVRDRGGENKPVVPIVKGIKYYQNQIKQNQEYIVDCDQMLKEIKKNKDGYNDEKDYQSAIDEVTAQKYLYQSEINEFQYQILLLEKEGDNFSPDQILQGITIFTKKNSNLNHELKLKEKYSDYYSQLELQVIKDAIKVTKQKLEMFTKLKEEKNVTISFSNFIVTSRC